MSMRFSGWLFFMMGLLSGCAQSPVSQHDDESRQLTQLLAWSQRVAHSPPEAQKKELGAANLGFAKGPGTITRLRLALLLAQPGTMADDSRAAGLLEPFAGAGADAGPLRHFGSLLQIQVSERIKEQRRAQQYRDQLEALRNLERSLREREREREQGKGRGK
jgi:hypothetical protein